MESIHRLIVYDIRDSKRLRKVEKCMESFAWRVQKSVFESNAPDNSIAILKSKLSKIIDTEADFILFFEICERDWQKQERYGINSREAERMSDDKFQIL